MKKVAFTLGLAFFAVGLFAQSSTGTNQAKATSAPVSVTKKEPMKAAPAAKPASAPKSASSMPAQKPADKPVAAKAKTAGNAEASATPVKKHRTHKAKRSSTAPKTATTPKTAPKANKQ